MKAFIPYGGYWSTPFARWSGELAHLHAIEFAAHVTKAELARRELDPTVFDFAAYGLTVPQKSSFYGVPWFGGMIGADTLTGPTINQACATGARLFSTAAGEIATGGASTCLIVSGDRCSNGPHLYYPAPHGPGGTGASEDWVLDSFSNDPWARCAMVQTAENVAAREGITTEEQHEVVLHRSEQYAQALADEAAFLKRFMTLPFDVPDARFRKTQAVMEADTGIHPSTAEGLAKLKPVMPDGTVTFGGQTHPADGSAAAIVVESAERAAELASNPDITIELVSFGLARVEKAHMPAAPIPASLQALERAGKTIADMAAIKSHNPFAVNDIAFARAMGIDWRSMNNFGSSLIWGHPQGPTGVRAIIELIEELALKGGGYGLFQGCAAGDSSMAVVLKVG
ncbi:thiolase family protein [Amorphus orientalis]|uniref:Acetyl-CoA acetyltransferase n=1 Tax=Amorphus orientalis TaxID=649198 RepID=A0AAE3VQH5_9HYPH|nr:thiolase family protein [Amorphus orientalis]MDQ0316459.1 acetyl-CoA acetyltransferase [Amorphus orientalis]